MPAAIHLYRHMQTAWREVVRPWLGSDLGARGLGRSTIVVPTRGQAHAFKQRCLIDSVPLLGVELLTPGLARRKWAALMVARGTVLRPTLGREFLLLGLRTIIERRLIFLNAALLSEPETAAFEKTKNEIGVLKSLRSDCENALNDFDDLLRAGFSAAQFPDPVVREIFSALATWVHELGYDFALNQTTAFLQRDETYAIPGRLFIHGFSAEQRNEFSNVAAFARCFDDVTLTLPEPEFRQRKRNEDEADKPALDEAWIELWEKTLDAQAVHIDAQDEPKSCENVAEIWSASDPDALAPEPPSETQMRLLVGVTRADEMIFVADEIEAQLAAGAENIGVIFPKSDACHLRLVDLLVQRGVAFVDQLESVSAATDIIQTQRALLTFYERGCRLEDFIELWPLLSLSGMTELPLPDARDVVARLFDECQSHSLVACARRLAEHDDPKWSAVWSVAKLLLGANNEYTWPDELTFARALELFSDACVRCGVGEIPGLKALENFATCETSPLPSTVVFLAFKEFLAEKKQIPKAPGRNCFARVTLTSRRRAEGAIWSHAIFVEANTGVWPQRQEATCWLTDNARETLNARRHDGIDLLRADDRAFLEKRSYAALARDTSDTIAFSAALFNEDDPEVKLAPNSWVERVRWHALTKAAAGGVTPKYEEIFEILARNTQRAIEPAGSIESTKHWHDIWLGRRDPEKTFDEYFLSVDPRKNPIESISARRIESGFKDPASLWFDVVLGLQRVDWAPFARNRNKSLGTLAHLMLAKAFRGDQAEGNFQVMPREDAVREQLAHALEIQRTAWPRDCYWDSFYAELCNVCSVMVGKVFALPGDYVAAEYSLPKGVTLPVGAADSGAGLAVHGRMDLLRLNAPRMRGAHVEIVDFKTGKDAKISADAMASKGSSLQLGVYLAAAQALGATSGSVSMFKPVATEPTRVDMEELPQALAGLAQIHRHITEGRYGALTADRSEYSMGGTEWPIACTPIPNAILKKKFELTFGVAANDAESEGGDE